MPASLAFSGYVPQQHAILLRAQYYEWHKITLLDRRSGRMTDFDDEPHFSPDGKRFVTATTLNEQFPDTQDHLLAIYAGGDPPKLEWAYSGEFNLFAFKEWDGNTRLRLLVGKYPEGEATRDATLEYSPAGWGLKVP